VNTATQNGDKELAALEHAGKTLMPKLIAAFPECSEAWAAHSMEWEGEPPVPYLDISVFARFVEEKLLITGETAEAKRALALLDTLFIEGNEPTRDLIGIGFVEDLANITSHRNGGNAQVVALLPPVLTKVWRQIESQWSGRTSLMEVLEAEASDQPAAKTWAELIDLP
jgi:hypothetical protein